MNDIELIKYLSWDKTFGILTRPALELEIKKLNVFQCYLIDLHNVKNLNKLIGYGKVNTIIRNIFETYQASTKSIIGRWFSGDEVLIIDDNIETSIAYLEKIAHSNGLSFKHFVFDNVINLKDLEGRIDAIKGG